SPTGVLLLAGQMDRPAFLRDRFTTWEAVRLWANRELPRGARILFTGEERRRLRQRGLTHHLHNFVSAQFREIHWYTWTWQHWDARQLAVYREFVARYERSVYRPAVVDFGNGGFHVFEFTRAPARVPAPVYFLPHTEGLFRPALARGRAGDLAGCAREARAAAGKLPGVIQAQEDLGFYLAQLDRYADAVAAMRP